MATRTRTRAEVVGARAGRPRRSVGSRGPDAAGLIGAVAAVAAVFGLFVGGSVAAAVWLAAPPLAVALVLRPDWAILVLAFITYTRFSNVIAEHHGFVWISSFLVALLVVIAGVRWRFWREPPLRAPIPIAIVAGYGLLSASSLLYARHQEAVADWLVMHGKIMIAALAALLLAKGLGSLRSLAWGVIAAVLFVGTLGVLKFATGAHGNAFDGFAGSISDGGLGHRLVGPIGDPNYFAALLVFAVPLAMERCLRERTLLARGLAGWALVAALICIYFTASRGAVVALAVLSLAAILIYRPRQPVLILIPLVLAATSVLVSETYLARVESIVSAVPGIETAEGIDSSIEARLKAWQVGLALFAEHPILGVGVGNFDLYYYEEARLLGLPTNQRDQAVHSLLLEVAAERGLVGVIAFAGLLGATASGIMRAHRAVASTENAEEATLVSAFGCGLLGYLGALMFLNDAFPQFFWLALFALHGFRHVDHSRLSFAQQVRHLELSRRTLARCGIEAHGFRAPYLRWNPETLAALRDEGFAYDSSQALDWSMPNDAAPPSYGRALRFYGARSAADVPSVPNLRDGLVEIPYSLPDDEALIERWNLQTPEQIAAVWTSILRRSHEYGELFTLGLHPERIRACREALATVLAEARDLVPAVWIARLSDIASWWRARISTVFEIGEVGRKVHVTVTGPPQLTVLARAVQVDVPTTPWDDHYRKVTARRFSVDSTCHPFIGLSSTTSPQLVDFLWQQGYLTLTGAGAAQCAHYFDCREFDELQRRCILERIEGSDRPLVRLGRWPDGARSALAISGDIDALTLWDYGLRLLGR